MTRYNTGYPVPSPAMPDVWDNNETIDGFVNSTENSVTTRTGIVRDTMFGMQKKADEQRIAASVALAEQMDSQESAFNAAQTDKEDRFQGFLNSSGYVFLGNYENGPFQFSARNQYIRYNNQYYRLNATTDVGFTTTGTDATSFASDVTHFVLMDGDTLRQNLGSGEGAMKVYRNASPLARIIRSSIFEYLTEADQQALLTTPGVNVIADYALKKAIADGVMVLDIPWNVGALNFGLDPATLPLGFQFIGWGCRRPYTIDDDNSFLNCGVVIRVAAGAS
ncbi:TPA: hypothetical protein L9Y32_004986, partial [Klebsiella pneumoniae]|nr:hypothetical protein [Klebsiella pneumoniae]